MYPAFIKGLSVSDEERAKLASFGAKSPLALLEMRKASRDAFDDFVGRERAPAIAEQIENLLSDEERTLFNKPTRAPGRLGGRLDSGPDIKR